MENGLAFAIAAVIEETLFANKKIIQNLNKVRVQGSIKQG